MNYSALPLYELKALANGLVPTGDKRIRQSWIDALELRRRSAALDAVEPTTDEEFEAALSERECLGEFSESEMAAWEAPEMPSHAEQEAISHAADSALEQTVEPAAIAPEPAPAVEEVLYRKSDKKGAATVFSALLCILILTIQAVLCIGCVIVQAAIHLRNLFGAYNPDYDLLGQLQDMVRQRKSIVPAQQAQQPAY